MRQVLLPRRDMFAGGEWVKIESSWPEGSSLGDPFEVNNPNFVRQQSGGLRVISPKDPSASIGGHDLWDQVSSASDYVDGDFGKSFSSLNVVVVDDVRYLPSPGRAALGTEAPVIRIREGRATAEFVPPSSTLPQANITVPFHFQQMVHGGGSVYVGTPQVGATSDGLLAELRRALGVARAIHLRSRHSETVPPWLLAGLGFWFYCHPLPTAEQDNLLQRFKVPEPRTPSLEELNDVTWMSGRSLPVTRIGYYAVRRYRQSACSLERMIDGNVRPSWADMLEDILRLYGTEAR